MRPYAALRSAVDVLLVEIWVRSASAWASICRCTEFAIREKSGSATGRRSGRCDGGLSTIAPSRVSSAVDVAADLSGPDTHACVAHDQAIAQTAALAMGRHPSAFRLSDGGRTSSVPEP